MLNSRKRVVEMPGGGKRRKPKPGFPRFPPPLEIAPRFPHSHNPDDYSPVPKSKPKNQKGAPATQKAPTPVFRLIFDEKMLCRGRVAADVGDVCIYGIIERSRLVP